MQVVAEVDTIQIVTASPMNGCNTFLDSHRAGVPGKRRVSASQPLTTMAPQYRPQLPPSSSPHLKLGLTSSVQSFPTHPTYFLLLHAQLEIPSALSRESWGVTAKHVLLGSCLSPSLLHIPQFRSLWWKHKD